ncbi:uncharacterized protein LOC131939335 isoform X2 [Physella acuta]|uniref:uncharacterized protein LOC131939335 isoform X2 n=1 Tax=Physella acuta TaxID=109671 RepID=UPI0027DD3197|nr:uncharacterized protein LOC131939335 isoform X2 [Physella acuta]
MVILKQPSTPLEVESLFKYGEAQGDKEFREELSKFLTSEYNSQVDSNNLFVTAGATNGLHLILSLLCEPTSPVFIEDPSYFIGIKLIRDDLKMDLVSVYCDEQGIVPTHLEQAICDYKNQSKGSHSKRFWAAVYLIPVFGNPTGWVYSPERCVELIHLARKHDVLLIVEDVYNLIYYTDKCPPRLLAFDKPSDPDYAAGHVLSNATFSKIFAPSIRLGWIEGSRPLLSQLYNSNLSLSGGGLSHCMARLMTQVISSGALTQHVIQLRDTYKERMSALCDCIDQLNITGWSYTIPKGGFFLWLVFPPHIDAAQFANLASQHSVFFLPGSWCSAQGSYKNCARLSFSYITLQEIPVGVHRLAAAYRLFTSTTTTS